MFNTHLHYICEIWIENTEKFLPKIKMDTIYTLNGKKLLLFLVDAPKVTLKDKVDIEKDKMIVYWEYNQNRRKRNSHLPITIRVNYRISGDEDYTLYPPESESAANVEQRQLTVPGDFSTEASYDVKLAIYEGGVPVPSQDSNQVSVKPPTNPGKCIFLIN